MKNQPKTEFTERVPELEKETKFEVAKEVEVKPTVEEVKQVVEKPVAERPVEKIKPTVIMSEIDSLIHDTIQSQPKTLEEIKVTKPDVTGLHRLSLPDYFETFSYDCTRGDACRVHKKSKNQFGQRVIENRGKYIFRWIFKRKRAFEEAIKVRGWAIANRTFFPDAPESEFNVSGAVENWDSILGFMPVEQALELRNYPGKKSQEILKSRMTPSKKGKNRVLMTGDPSQDHIYEPEMGAEEGDGEVVSPGSFQEGRDF